MQNPFAHRHDAPVGLITITVMLGLIMAIIDSTIVNVALPTLGGNLGATVDEVAWVATGYILANVVVMPLKGWLTALLGRKMFYATSLAVFTVASFLCGTAHSIWVLVFYRVVQGLGGGALQPTAQAILFETFPIEKRGAAMAIFGMGAMVGPAIGPTLGGWIIDNATWPLIFYINLPIGIVAFLMTLAFIPNPKYIARPKGGIDWAGLGLLTAGLASLQFVLEQGERDDWFQSQTIVLFSAIAAVALIVFVFTLGFFVTPAILGGGRSIMAAELVWLRMFQSPDWGLGAAISVALVAVVGTLMAALFRVARPALMGGSR